MIAIRRRVLWVLLAIVTVALLAFVAQHDPAKLTQLAAPNYSALAEQLVVILLIGALALSLFRERLSDTLEAGLIWIVVGLLLTIAYTYRSELHAVADRALAQFITNRVVEIERTPGGDFTVTARINGAKVGMVLDSGASAVVLTNEAARAAGLPLEMLQYSVKVDTANGHTAAAPVTLDRLAVGGVVERSVPALIAQPGQLKSSLLGMSFLNRLESWEVRGDTLVIRGYP